MLSTLDNRKRGAHRLHVEELDISDSALRDLQKVLARAIQWMKSSLHVP
jgi:hypothetical protein